MIAPGLCRLRCLFEDDVFSTPLVQMVANGKPCLPAADDDSVNLFSHWMILHLLVMRRIPDASSVLVPMGSDRKHRPQLSQEIK